MNDYQEQALRTRSDEFHADRAPAWMFVAVLDELVEHGRKLDALKKAMFYGKPLPSGLAAGLGFRFAGHVGDRTGLADAMADRMEGVPADVLHGLVGIVTEAVELAELLLRELDGGEPMDFAKVAEEVGDTMWYQALLLSGLGYGFSRAQQMNINKLKKRYPERFTAEAALARADES